jgi:hypothetical protein
MSDMLTVIERQRAEDTWGVECSMICAARQDARLSLTSWRSSPGLQHTSCDRAATWSSRLLVTDPILYGVFSTYAALGLSKVTIQAFRALDEPISGWPQTRAQGS